MVATVVFIPVLGVHVGETGGYVDRGFPELGAPDDAYPLLMAGGIAGEWLYWDDLETAWQHGAGDREVLSGFGHPDSEILGWVETARGIIEAHLPAWRRVANLLDGGGTFDGDAIRRVLAGP